MDGRRPDLDRQAAGDDRRRDLDQTVRHDAGQRERPGREGGGEPEQETGREGDQEPAHPHSHDGEDRDQDEREQVVGEDRDRAFDRSAAAGRPDQAGEDRAHDLRGNGVGRAGHVADGGAERETGGGDQHRHPPHPDEAKETRPALKAPGHGRDRPTERMPQADVAREQRFARETVEAHAHENNRDHRHQERKAPQELSAPDEDQGGLDLEDDRHRQDDEGRHYVGRAHGPRVEADDHRAGDHRRDLADRGQPQRDQDAEWEVAETRERDQAVDQQAAVAERQRDGQYRDHLAGVDLGLAQRRGQKDLERGALALADERFECEHEREARRDEDDKERADQGKPVDHGRPAAERRERAHA